MASKKIIVIGAGFSGISAATDLAHKGYHVTILEKNSHPGGRARSYKEEGFTFDMGPSWYWMPDVFEKWFHKYNKRPSDYYLLKRLDPSYKIFFGKDDAMLVPAVVQELKGIFENLEKGSGNALDKFLKQAQYKYEVGMHNLVYKPGRSIKEYYSAQLLVDLIRMDILQSFHSHIRKFFKNEKIIQLMEFPVLFLGAIPKNTPALYSLMNYADIQLGTWYPMGGMYKIIEGMVDLAKSKGVSIFTDEEVTKIQIRNNKATHVHASNHAYEADVVVAGADYHHIEQNILGEKYRSYSSSYWNSRIMAPSSLIFYLGLKKKVKNLSHHNLFFDQDFSVHSNEIYENPSWPSNPLFYVCVPSVTDPEVAPEGCENMFVLMPVAPGLEDTEETREKYFNMIMDRLEDLTSNDLRDSIIYKRSYAHKDFINDYHAFKGNAYGLANTLWQTAILKPSLKSKKVNNLYYTGQLTVPGPGVPPSIISGQVVAEEIHRDVRQHL